MKKNALLFLILSIFVTVFVFKPSLTYAYSGGLYNGKSFGLFNSGETNTISGVTDWTDNNEGTTRGIPSGFYAEFKVTIPTTILSYKMKASAPLEIRVYPTTNTNERIRVVANPNGVQVGLNEANFDRIRVYNTSAATIELGEFDVFSAPAPTPTPAPKPPNNPAGLTATAGNTTVSLNWNDVVEATNYKIYQDGNLIATTSAKPYKINGLTNGTLYSYQVASVNGNGESGKSAMVTATPTLPPPAGLTATAGNTTVSLDWNDVGFATKYKIYQDGILLTTTATKPYLINGLTNGTVYSYQVTAVNGSIESAKTTTVTAKPDNPAVPSGFIAIAGNKEILLDWITVSNATNYKIYKDGSYSATVTNKPYLITALTNGTVYSFEITAVNAMGESEKSGIITASPIDSLPPTGLTSNVSNSKINVSWNRVNAPPATKYRLYRDGVLLSELTGVTYSDTGLTNGTTYKYEVSAVNISGESAKSTAIFAKPSKDIANFTVNILPFSVLDMLKTTVNFLMIYGLWIVLALAVLFSPVLYRLAIKLIDPKKENEESDKAYTREGLRKMIKAKGYKISKRAEDKIYRDGRKAQRNAEKSRYGGMTKEKWEKFSKEEIERTNKYFEKTGRVYESRESREARGSNVRTSREKTEGRRVKNGSK